MNIRKENNKGITLIALIVTIIVLMILAGVTIALTTDGNILRTASNVGTEAKAKTAAEMMTIKMTGIEMKIFTEKKRSPTLAEVAEILKEDGEISYVGTNPDPEGTQEEITDETEKIYAALGAYPYIFEINNDLDTKIISGYSIAVEESNSNPSTGGGSGSGSGSNTPSGPKLITSISIEPSTANLDIGDTTTLSATVFGPEGANSSSIEWVSSNESVATVSSDGVVTAVSDGTTIITASSTDGGNVTSNGCTVTVYKSITEISITTVRRTIDLANSETQLQLNTSITPNDAIGDRTIQWTSSDETIATVDSDGIVTANGTQKAGETTITASVGNVSTECVVYVIKDGNIDIYNLDDFNRFARISNSNNFSGKTARLMADITLNASSNTYLPMWNSTRNFNGTFNGMYHVIKGINISSGDNTGLFGVIGTSGVVQNLAIEGTISRCSKCWRNMWFKLWTNKTMYK